MTLLWRGLLPERSPPAEQTELRQQTAIVGTSIPSLNVT